MACQHKNSINYYEIGSYDIILLDLTFVMRVNFVYCQDLNAHAILDYFNLKLEIYNTQAIF